ncbi:ArsC2 [Desulforapulum autotrophicum HRM2]|uniref:ArsC2 n=1 Tax=Desulforapulum autotrophicum (strain ATCC 43914 / DSM 3382 / VKM B-1955 / HRM2) TaxID=177437 RepID=C0QD18_DESAH|nr:NAD(P)H-dependent oxidoreductase [Desulforapulum autotrophicum]ACN17250.1 ArsC2 [Desulforapulum autotrophicum HRM2]
MLVLAIKGSPRKKGNTDYLLGLFMAEARKRGWETEVIDAVKENFEPCIGCGNCERTGFCSIKDTMPERFFSPLRRADVVVVSVPTYFYAVPARIKGLMDRTQTLWSRKYLFKIKDAGHDHRKGVLLAAAATHGRDLFDGIKLNVKYFLDAAGAAFEENLCYRGIDSRGAMERHPTVHGDVALLAQRVLSPFEQRRTWVFACRENAGRSQMAAAFARFLAGDRIEVISAGSAPGEKVNPLVVAAMAEKGIDLAFLKPVPLGDILEKCSPHLLVTMGCGQECPLVPGCRVVDWDLPDPAAMDLDGVRALGNEIEKRVNALVKDFSAAAVE